VRSTMSCEMIDRVCLTLSANGLLPEALTAQLEVHVLKNHEHRLGLGQRD
jgi:hypothetical protein